MSDPVKIANAATKAIAALADEPLSLEEMQAALTAAAGIVGGAIAAQRQVSIFQRVLGQLKRG